MELLTEVAASKVTCIQFWDAEFLFIPGSIILFIIILRRYHFMNHYSGTVSFVCWL